MLQRNTYTFWIMDNSKFSGREVPFPEHISSRTFCALTFFSFTASHLGDSGMKLRNTTTACSLLLMLKATGGILGKVVRAEKTGFG